MNGYMSWRSSYTRREPMDRPLWDRAGGDPADAPDAVTGRDRWRLALDAVEMAPAALRNSPPSLTACWKTSTERNCEKCGS